jgi:SAM-dependent MidA family methyltransferase
VQDRRRWRTWRRAMDTALYGPDGFYRSAGAPARHFRTAVHASPLWAQAIGELARRVDSALGEPESFAVVDVGAGGGELIAALASGAPSRWSLVGVDVAPRPAALPRRVSWVDSVPAEVTGLLVACEWLDVVPVDVVELTDDGVRLVEVADDGTERLGEAPSAADCAWLQTWWPLAEIGDRAEVGSTRDAAWASLLSESLLRGAAVAVDYAADPTRDVAGTMTGYRDGRQVAPVPDGSCDITAHVLIESCAAAVDDVTTETMMQRDALRQLGISGERPAYDGDPPAYVAALSQAGAAAELLDPYGLGGFTWLVHARNCPPPLTNVRRPSP